MLKIYLAGPFFNEKQIDLIERIENEFDKGIGDKSILRLTTSIRAFYNFLIKNNGATGISI